jgi:ferredoxin-type protein NapH
VTKIRIARLTTAALAILVIAHGVVAIPRGAVVGEFGYGGICTLAVREIWARCPLGFLERSIASGELVQPWLVSAVLVVLSVILLGRVFCAWVCPTVLLRRVFKDTGGLKSMGEAAQNGFNWSSYSPYAVLGGVLLASFVFQFPVFCFFCPIGIFFGFLSALLGFFSLHSFTLQLVLFPLMLGFELWGLKSWCRSICPVGALLSLIGNLNHLLLPVVRKEKCLTSKGINCQACRRVCPEGIDLTRQARFSPSSCTKCLNCSERCPVKAIEIRPWA